MSEINPDGFTGIEIETHLPSSPSGSAFINKLMGRRTPSKLTVIGPANRIERLHKDEKLITTFISQKNIISKDEFINATFTQHYRTVEEFIKPFDDPNSEVSKSGLVLNSYKTMFTDCPYKIYYEKNKNTMTSQDYANTLIPTMRSWSETVFKTALQNRNDQEINKIVHDFYNSYQDEVSSNPDGHAMDYIHIVMDIEKK